MTPLGVSGSAPVLGAGGLVGTSSYLLRCAPTRILLDAGVGAGRMLSRREIGRLDAVLVTHAHEDHIAGLLELAQHTARRGRRLPVFGPASLGTELVRRLAHDSSPRFGVRVAARVDDTARDPSGASAGQPVGVRGRAGRLYTCGSTRVLVGAGVEVDAWLGALDVRDQLTAVVVGSLRDRDIAGLVFLAQNRLYPKDNTGASIAAAARIAREHPIALFGPPGLRAEIAARSADRGYAPYALDDAFQFHEFPTNPAASIRVGELTLTVTAHPHAPAETGGGGRVRRDNNDARLAELVEFTPLQPGRPVRIGACTVRAIGVDHLGIPAYALRVTGRHGAALLYSGDSGFTPALIDAAAGVDLAVLNAFCLACAEQDGLHLSGRGAGTIAARAGVGYAVLAHHHPRVDAAAIRAEAAAVFTGPLRTAVTGERYLIATPRARTITGTPPARRAVTVIAATTRRARTGRGHAGSRPGDR
ncbi:MAG TPA: MBL fold metallo-hydrolase [Pseudonocardia sp.]